MQVSAPRSALKIHLLLAQENSGHLSLHCDSLTAKLVRTRIQPNVHEPDQAMLLHTYKYDGLYCSDLMPLPY